MVLPTPEPQERKIFLTAFLAGFVSFGLLYSPQPILHLFTERFGVPPHVSALAISLPTLFLAFSSIFMIYLRGRIALGRVVPVAIVAAAAANMVAVLAPSWTVVIVARGAVGIMIGLVPASVMAFVAKAIPVQRMGRAMSWYIAGTGSGGLIGRLAAGLLTEVHGYQAALGAISAISLAIGLFLWFSFPPEAKRQGADPTPLGIDPAALRRAALTPSALSIYVLCFALMSSFVGIFNYLSYLLSSRFGLSEGSLTMGFLPLASGILAVPLFGRLYDRLGPRVMLCFAFAMIIAGTFLTVTESLVLLFVGITAIALGAFSGHSSASATLGRLVEVDKNYASSIYMFSFYFGASLTGYSTGMLYHLGGWDWVAGFTVALAAAGLAITLIFVGRVPKGGGSLV